MFNRKRELLHCSLRNSQLRDLQHKIQIYLVIEYHYQIHDQIRNFLYCLQKESISSSFENTESFFST